MRPRILLPMIMLLTLVAGTAQAALTRLIVTAHDNAPIMVFVDDVQYGPFSNRHKIQNLAPGVHNMRVVALYSNPYSVRNTQRQVYFGPVNIPDGHEVHTMVNPTYGLSVTEMISLLPVVPQPVRPGFCGTPIVQKPVYIPPVATPLPVGPQPMHPQQFEEIVRVIRDQSFESTRSTVAKQIISQHYFTSAQVRRLLDLFWFDSGRLDIAKFAYTHVVDPDRYYLTFDAFSFDSSVNDLSRYMNSVMI